MLGARIFAVADTLDCMTSNRPFQRACGFDQASREILLGAGSQFDPNIVAAFREIALDDWQHIRISVAANGKKVLA